MRDYTDHPQLSSYLFEHSFVLGISAEPTSLTLRVDLVLTPEHPRFQAARLGE